MTINQMRYFRELAHTEHYGRAAEALYIAQPTLSRAIALLEEELDVGYYSNPVEDEEKRYQECAFCLVCAFLLGRTFAVWLWT